MPSSALTLEYSTGRSYTVARCFSTQLSNNERAILREINGNKDLDFQTIFVSQSVGNEQAAAEELAKEVGNDSHLVVLTSRDLSHAILADVIGNLMAKGGKKDHHILLMVHSPNNPDPENSLASVRLLKLNGANRTYQPLTLWEHGRHIMAGGTA